MKAGYCILRSLVSSGAVGDYFAVGFYREHLIKVGIRSAYCCDHKSQGYGNYYFVRSPHFSFSHFVFVIAALFV